MRMIFGQFYTFHLHRCSINNFAGSKAISCTDKKARFHFLRQCGQMRLTVCKAVFFFQVKQAKPLLFLRYRNGSPSFLCFAPSSSLYQNLFWLQGVAVFQKKNKTDASQSSCFLKKRTAGFKRITHSTTSKVGFYS